MTNAHSRTILVRNGWVLSMDDAVGDLTSGDVLIENGRISAVAEHVTAPSGQVEEIDATGCLVLPGLVDTHRHMWQGGLRGSAPHSTLMDYLEQVCGQIGPAMRPRDFYVGNMLSARSALNAGVTAIQDVSNAQATPSTRMPSRSPCKSRASARSSPTARTSWPSSQPARPCPRMSAGCAPTCSPTTTPWSRWRWSPSRATRRGSCTTRS